MVGKAYQWAQGADLLPHSAKKLKILRDYFSEYLRVRCQHPQRGFFRLAVVDGFSGAGRYRLGEAGSPIVVVETLRDVCAELNSRRKIEGLKPLSVECDLLLNDADAEAYHLVKMNVLASVAEATAAVPQLAIHPIFLNSKFENAYFDLKKMLIAKRHQNVVFNLDPCGNSLVDRRTIFDIMSTFKNGEVFLTFMIQTLLAFLHKSNRSAMERQLRSLDICPDRLDELDGKLLSRVEWLGFAERIVFETFKNTAPFVSPFSICNPEGWRYWLLHFSHIPRARQVYNDILHQNSTAQAHFGRSGLEMLSYTPQEGGSLHLFDENSRAYSREQLMIDIPRFISDHGDLLSVAEFQFSIYNLTPAHSQDINLAVFENPEIEVLTARGGERRRAHTIASDDVLRLKRQMTFPALWSPPGKRA